MPSPSPDFRASRLPYTPNLIRPASSRPCRTPEDRSRLPELLHACRDLAQFAYRTSPSSRRPTSSTASSPAATSPVESPKR